MTTTKNILRTLDFLTKEQEEHLALAALNDVIDRFETTFTVVYSEAGIPLLDDSYFDKAKKSKKVDEKILSPAGEKLADADPSELSFDEKKQAAWARGVRKDYDKLAKEHQKYGRDTELLNGLLTEMLSGAVETTSPDAEGNRKPRTQGRPPKAARQLLDGFAAQYDQMVDAVVSGKSPEEVAYEAFPRQGLRMNVKSDAGVDIQVRIRLNTDGKSFKLEQREGGKGRFTVVTGGAKVKSFGAAIKHGEKLITDKAQSKGAQLQGVDIGTGKQRRQWLNANVRQHYAGPMTKMQVERQPETPEPQSEEAFAKETEKNITTQLTNAGIDDKLIQQSVEFNADRVLINSGGSLAASMTQSPWDIVKDAFRAVTSGQVTDLDDLNKVISDAAKKISQSSLFGPNSPNRGRPGTSEWGARAEVKSGLGQMFSGFAQAFTSGWTEGWEAGQYFGAKATGASKYRHPDSELYRRDPRGYWNERGKLVTMMAKSSAAYEDSINKAAGLADREFNEDGSYKLDKQGNPTNPRSDAIEKAMVAFAKSEDSIEALAKEKTGASLEAVREHLNQITQGNKDAMPPGEGFPDRFGGYSKRRALHKNVDKYVPAKPIGGMSGLLTGAAEKLLGPRGREKDASGKQAGVAQPEQGEARLHQQELAGGKQGAVSTRDREYLQPGEKAPKDVKEYFAERRGKDGNQARYYSRKEAAAIADQIKNGPTKDDVTDPSDPEGPTTDPSEPTPEPSEPTPEPTEPTPEPSEPSTPPTPKPKKPTKRSDDEEADIDEMLRRQRAQARKGMQHAKDKGFEEEPEDPKAIQRRQRLAKKKREQEEKEQKKGVAKAGEDEMAPVSAPQPDPRQAQADQYQKAVDNEIAETKKVVQNAKVSGARDNARAATARSRVTKARADEAEVKARQAEEARETHIADILSKLDYNISTLATKSNPKVSDIFTQLEKTIDSIEYVSKEKKPDVRVGPRPEPSVIEPSPSDKPREGIDYTRGSSAKKTKGFKDKQNGGTRMDKQNPFDMLAQNLKAGFHSALTPKQKRELAVKKRGEEGLDPASATTQEAVTPDSSTPPNLDSGHRSFQAPEPTPAKTKPSPAKTKPSPADTKPSPAATKPTPAMTKPTPASPFKTPAMTKPTPAKTKPSPALVPAGDGYVQPHQPSLAPSALADTLPPPSSSMSPPSTTPPPSSSSPKNTIAASGNNELKRKRKRK